MTANKSVTIFCDGTVDGGRCQRWIYSDWHVVMEARKEAREAGWTTGAGGQDFCPACSARMLS